MFWNYMKTALRNLARQKIFTTVNILGLAVGLSIFILAMLYVNFYLSYDKFHEDSGRIYCLSSIDRESSEHTNAPMPIIAVLKEEVPEIENASIFLQTGKRNVTVDGKHFTEEEVRYADSDFLKIFSSKTIAGEKETMLDGPNKVVLSRSTAVKWFGDQNPIGKTVNYESIRDLVVTGVTEDYPVNSSVKYKLLISFDTIRNDYDNWEYYSPVFIRLAPNADRGAVETKLAVLLESRVPESDEKPVRFFLYPFTKLIYRPASLSSFCTRTEPIQQMMIVLTAILLLVVVCLNFASLSTARYLTRAKEVGLRKVLGAHRGQLVSQFLGESVLMALVAFPLSLFMYRLLVPMFLQLMGLKIDMGIMNKPLLLLACFGTAVTAGLLAGSYPAFFVSAFQPATVFKGDLRSFLKGTRMRKILIVAQFSLTIVLMIFSMVFGRQSNHLLKTNLGLDRSDVMVVNVHAYGMSKLEIFRDEVIGLPGVAGAANSTYLPFDLSNAADIRIEGRSAESAVRVNSYPADYGMVETLDMKVLQGRGFSREFQAKDECVITRSAAVSLKLEDPIGQRIILREQPHTVVGILEEFHFEHVFYKMQPAILSLEDSSFVYMFVEVESADRIPELKKQITAKWASIAPGMTIEFDMLEDLFVERFRDTVKGQDLLRVFSGISVLFSLLGLIGLASYTIERQRKEIAVRKILGASVNGIVRTITLRFLALVAISNAIAWPVAWYASRWFTNFAWVSRIGVGFDVFLYAGLVSVFSAAVAVIFQARKAAVKNPVESLRYE